MTYAVIDTEQFPHVRTREDGERYLAQLRHYNPSIKWELVVTVTPQPVEQLEQLYALASMMLQASGINPLGITLVQAQLDGSEREISAVTVMNNARTWIDQIQATPN